MSWTKWLVATPLRCSLVVAMSALAFAGDDRQTSASLRFRRVLIPAARLADWPREPGVEFVPVPAAEFERLLKRAGAGDVAQPPAARVAKAEYDLRLLGPANSFMYSVISCFVTRQVK